TEHPPDVIPDRAHADSASKPISPHTLRHAIVTAALDAGVPLRDVPEAASHADPQTTMRYDNSRASLDRHATYIDRHATYIVAAYLAGAASGLDRGTWHLMGGLPYVARLAFGFRVPRHRRSNRNVPTFARRIPLRHRRSECDVGTIGVMIGCR